MARPQKNGLAYYAQDVNENNEFVMQLMIAKFGFEGVGFYRTMKDILFGQWYYLPFNDDCISVMAKNYISTPERIKEMLLFLVEKEIFNKSIYQKYEILTSYEMQTIWLKGSEKKGVIRIVEEIWIIDESEYVGESVLKKIVFTDFNYLSRDVFSEKTPQIKEKEIKEKKKNIEKKEHGGEAPPDPPLCVDSESEDLKEEKEKPKPQPGKQPRKQAEKQRIDQQAAEIIDYLNQKTGKKYRHSKAHLTVIAARLKEGFTLDDCKRVIDTKTAQWLNDEKEKYLRPETLFRPSKFEGYLNEKPPGTFPQQKTVNHMTVSNDFTVEKRIAEIQRLKMQQEQPSGG
jgi:uncharacterized phage protein (TIGR02220 family)